MYCSVLEVVLEMFGFEGELKHFFHPQTDGQVEHTIQNIKYMLRDCLIEFKGNYDDHIPLMEFA